MDLKSQLAAAFGRDVPDDAPAAPVVTPSILSDDAHLSDPWLELLRDLVRSVPGAPTLAARPKLGQARQVTDQLLRSLKRSGRKRAAKDLAAARAAFQGKREKAAWAAIKERLAAAGVSDKSYRSIKQSGADPIVVWGRLRKLTDGDLAGVGTARLREQLLP